MTNETYKQAEEIQKRIDELTRILYRVEKIKLIRPQEQKKPIIRFTNALKLKDGKEIREATVILFDGISLHGTDIPIDDGLADVIKKYYEQKLEEAKKEFNSL